MKRQQFNQAIQGHRDANTARHRDNHVVTQRCSRPGPKLSRVQREQLIKIVALFDDITTVQLILADDYPDIPEISDRHLRDIRQRIAARTDPRIHALVEEARKEIFTTGLALRAGRVAELKRMYREVVIVSRTASTDQMRGAWFRERQTILKQIREELTMGATIDAAAALAIDNGSAEMTDAELAEEQRELGLQIEKYVEDRINMERALRESQLPPEDE